MFAVFGAISAYAANNGVIEVHLNGVTLPSDLQPVIQSDRVYVPLRTIAEALNYNVDYDDTTRTAVISNQNAKLVISLDSLSATLNGTAVDMPVPAMIINDRIMVPVRFLTESFGCSVNWYDYNGAEEGPRGLVDIYGAIPTTINGQISISSLINNTVTPVGDQDSHTITSNYAIPQIHGLNNADFEAQLNQSFQDDLTAEKQAVTDGGNDAVNSAASGYAYDYSYEGGFTCDSIGSDIITITLNGYVFMGGAHGSPIQTSIVIDNNKSKTLSLHDVLLPGQVSEDAIVSVINDMAAANPDDYVLYEDTNTVTADQIFRNEDGTERTNNFYFEGSNLAIFFQPYEIGPYSSGFITFKIPADKIADYIQPEYLQLLRKVQ